MNTLYKYKKIVEKYFVTYQNGDVHIGFGDVSSSKRVRYAGNKASMRRTGNVSDSRRPPDIVGKCSEVERWAAAEWLLLVRMAKIELSVKNKLYK